MISCWVVPNQNSKPLIVTMASFVAGLIGNSFSRATG
jgi:hypothetical protein